MRKWKPKADPSEESKDLRTLEVKITEQEIELSQFDKVIKGERKGVKIFHEDDKCIAFEDFNPIAKTHFIVLAKEQSTNILKTMEADGSVMGHLMVIAAKVAKMLNLEEGYRIVLDNGRNSFQTIPNVFLHVIGG